MCTQDHIGNEALQRAIKHLYRTIVDALRDETEIYHSIRDALHSKHIINANDYRYLCRHSDLLACSEYLLLLLFTSSHAQAFVQFRLALRDNDAEIVERIDQEVQSQTAQQQEQLDAGQSTDGTYTACLLSARNFK